MGPLILLGVGVFGVFVLVWWISTSNRGVALRAVMRESRSNVDVQLKRRHDLIPQLVNVAKGYAAHEKELFERVALARTRAEQSLHDEDTGYGEEVLLMQEVKRFVAVMEGYPDLKADKHFLHLMEEMKETEDRIAAARRFYNANVRDWNNLREMFPSSLVVQGGEGFYLEFGEEVR